MTPLWSPLVPHLPVADWSRRERAPTPEPALGGEDLLLPLAIAPGSFVYAVVDDGGTAHQWLECRTDRNTSELAEKGRGPD